MAQAADIFSISHPAVGNVRELLARLEKAKGRAQSKTGIVIEVNADSAKQLDVYVSALEMLGQYFSARVAGAPEEAVKLIVQALVPAKPVTSTQLKQAQMLAKAKTAVLQSGDWVSAGEIASLANFSSANPSSQPSKWKRDKRLFAIRHEGVDYFPLYGLDETASYRPLPALKEVISALEAVKDGWEMAYWFMSVNSWLGGKRPQDLLRSAPQQVLVAAQEEVAGITHG